MKKYFEMNKCKFGAILMSEFKMPYRLSIKVIAMDNKTGEIVWISIKIAR